MGPGMVTEAVVRLFKMSRSRPVQAEVSEGALFATVTVTGWTPTKRA